MRSGFRRSLASFGGEPRVPHAMRLGAYVTLAVIATAACQKRRDPGATAGRDDKMAYAATSAPAPGAPGAPSGEVTPRLTVPQVAEQLTEAFAGAAKAIRPSVVRIDVEISAAGRGAITRDEQAPELPDFLRRFFDFGGGRGPGLRSPLPSPTPVRGTGSGVILDGSGDIVTNAHVVENAQKVTISLVDGRKLPGKVMGRDRLTDVAVVRPIDPAANLTLARLGNSDQLRVGQWVLAVGSPLGLDQSVTAGIVSGLGNGHSRVRVSQRARGYIQTDASINPGNSGGPLVNLAAEVIGINTMINVGPGGAYGYAIPIKQVAQISQTLIKEGRVRYPYLGVQIQDVENLTDEARRQLGNVPAEGAVVAAVEPGSPAAEVGLKEGDIITRIDDQKVTGASDVVDYVSSRNIGTKVRVVYVRQDKSQSAVLTLREMPGEGDSGAGGEIGLALQTVTEELARSLGIPPSTKGAAVAEVKPNSPAARAGLQPGDVLVEVDRKPVASAEAAATALHAAGKREHLVRVVGVNGARFVTIAAP
jgi:serine protease Do